MNPVSNYALFFTRSNFIAPFILYILLAVLLLTFGWRRVGKLHNPRSTRLLRAFILALVFTPAMAFMEGVTFLPFLLAVFIMIISPFGFSFSAALILPVVNILTLLAGWGIFHLILKKDHTLASGSPDGLRKWILWGEVLLGYAFFWWVWSLALPVPVVHYFYLFTNDLSSRYMFNFPGRLDQVLYMFCNTLLLTIAVFACTWLYYRAAHWASNRSWLIVILFLAIILGLGWILFPASCDTHESWEDKPNRVCDCTGITFPYYPVMITDATTIDYCLGWETPVK
jgi:hypothetical protein